MCVQNKKDVVHANLPAPTPLLHVARHALLKGEEQRALLL